MEKKKYIILALIIIGLVLISGCAKKSTAETAPAGAFIGGTDGLIMSFVADAPPSEYPQGVAFDIIVNVENKGEYDIPDNAATIVIGGIPYVKEKTQTLTGLTGRQLLQKTPTPGGVTQAQFSSDGSPTFPGSQPQKISASICYPYVTKIQGTVCIRESLAKQTVGGAELCTITGDKTVFSSGAPIKITSLTESATSQAGKVIGLRFTMFVKDEGPGVSYLGETCPPNLADANRVKVKSAKLVSLGLDLDCKKAEETGVLITGDKGGIITCVTKEGANIAGEFEDVLLMELEYNYTQSITKSITFTTV